MLLILCFGILAQIALQWYIDSQMPALWKYKVASSIYYRFANNIAVSALIAVVFGVAAGLYAPIIVIGANILYEIIARFLLHPRWIQNYKSIHREQEVTRKKKEIQRSIEKAARKEGVRLYADELQHLVDAQYKKSADRPVIEQNIQQEETIKQAFLRRFS